MILGSAGGAPAHEVSLKADDHVPTRAYRKGGSWLLTTSILTSMGFACLAMFGIFWFGSIRSAISFMRGDRLIPDVYAKSFGVALSGAEPSVEFQLTNWATSPVKILGAKSSCTCVAATGLPKTVKPRESYTFRVNIRTKKRRGHISERLLLFADGPQNHPLSLEVAGTIQ